MRAELVAAQTDERRIEAIHIGRCLAPRVRPTATSSVAESLRVSLGKDITARQTFWADELRPHFQEV
jgi:hypothetical protein